MTQQAAFLRVFTAKITYLNVYIDSSDGSDETARMRRLVWSFSARRWDKYQHLRHNEHFDIRKRVSKIRDEKEFAQM